MCKWWLAILLCSMRFKFKFQSFTLIFYIYTFQSVRPGSGVWQYLAKNVYRIDLKYTQKEKFWRFWNYPLESSIWYTTLPLNLFLYTNHFPPNVRCTEGEKRQAESNKFSET